MEQNKKRVPLNIEKDSPIFDWVNSQENVNASIKWIIQNVINQTGTNVDLFKYLAKNYNIVNYPTDNNDTSDVSSSSHNSDDKGSLPRPHKAISSNEDVTLKKPSPNNSEVGSNSKHKDSKKEDSSYQDKDMEKNNDIAFPSDWDFNPNMNS